CRVEHEQINASIPQCRDERVSCPAAIGHHDNPTASSQRDSCCFAEVQGRAQDGDGNSSRHCVASLESLKRIGSGGGGSRFRPVQHEADDVVEGGEVPQLQVVVPGDAVGLPHGGEQLGLLHGVDAQVGLQVKLQVQHVLGVTGPFRHHRQHPLANFV